MARAGVAVFRGDFSITLDAKGRFAVPTRYRQPLVDSCGGKLVATISLRDKCLAVYPLPEWQRIEGEIHALPSLDPHARAVSHLLIGKAAELELDSHGRLLLPVGLREFAALDKHIHLIGRIRHFELWDDQAWTARCAELLASLGDDRAEVPDVLKNLVL